EPGRRMPRSRRRAAASRSQAIRARWRRTAYPGADRQRARNGTWAPACVFLSSGGKLRAIIVVRNGSKEQDHQETGLGSNYRPPPNRAAGGGPAPRALDRNFELKSQIHRKLIGVLNLDRVSSIPKDRVRTEIGRLVA